MKQILKDHWADFMVLLAVIIVVIIDLKMYFHFVKD